MSLAGFGDPDWFSIWRPGITTFAPNLTEMGRQAATMLLAKLAGQATEPLALIAGKVQIRGSVTGLSAA
jgi:LacI family transcriptional regulator